MALVVKDRVRETSTTTGTGTLTLAGAVTGFQTFSSAIGNANTTYYTIVNGSEWEVGIGTVGAGTLARTTVLASSNAGSAVTFSAGTKDVFCSYPAGKALYTDASGNAIGLGTVAATTTLTNATGLPISTGVSGLGTNVATALGTAVGSAGALVTNGGVLGTPSSGTLTNCTFPTLNQNTTGTAAGLSSTLVATSGGTGQSTYAIGDLLQGGATNTLTKLAAVATGNALISGGVGTASSWGKIGLATHVSGTLGATNGGTGLTAYTTGDIIYASATNTLSALADVATGNSLISGGVGVAPSWGKIGLTTHVSGTLAVGNGGTGATTLTGLVKGNGTSAFTAATSGTDYSAGTSALATGILKSTTTTGALSIAVAGDFPTLNQNTTGTAAGLSTTLVVGSGGTGATTLTGIVKGNGTSAFTAATAGTDYVAPATATNFTAQQYFGTATLTDGATISWAANTQQVATVTIAGNRTMAAPTGLVSGAFYSLNVIQDATGSRTMTWNAVFKWTGGTAPTLSTAASAKDFFVFRSDGTNLYEQGRSLGVA